MYIVITVIIEQIPRTAIAAEEGTLHCGAVDMCNVEG